MNPVFFPETAAICDADDLRRTFAAHEGDYYPDELYQNLFDYLCDIHAGEEFAEIDVVGLWCNMRAIIPADLPDDLREELATTYRHDVSAHTAALMKALREYAEKEGYYLATVEDLRSVWII